MPTPAKEIQKIPIARPTFEDDARELLEEVLKSGWVSQGPMVARFETMVAGYCGAKHCVATTSWTTGFLIALKLYDIGVGDEVLCPSYSFIATANVVRHVGAEPRFIDIDPATLNICPRATEAFITEYYDSDLRHKKSGGKLKAIMIVHQVGIPADIDAFAAIAKKYNLELLEDSACGLGSTYKNQPIGSSGFTGAFSFHPRKVITSGEGGMILLKDDTLAERARMLINHGASIPAFNRHGSKSALYEGYPEVGYNFRLSDLLAAVGVSQMLHLNRSLDRRAEIAQRYNEAFAALEPISIITPPDSVTRWNYQSYPVRLKDGSRETRDRLIALLDEAGVASRRGIPPIHLEPPYQENALPLPQTEAVSETSLFLPIFPGMTDEEVSRVVEAVHKTLPKI